MDSRTTVRRAFKKYRGEGLLPLFHSFHQRAGRLLLGERWFRSITKMRYIKHQHFYDAPAHPYKIISMNPKNVNLFNEEITAHHGLGVIKAGEWDNQEYCKPIRNTTHYRGFKQRFFEDYDWEDTVYYQKRIKNLTNHKKKRLEYVEQLFNDIKQNGYRPNYESKHDAPKGGKRQGSRQHVHNLEPLVVIGRDGDIYLSEGFHRFTIAKLLEIEEIPVNVLARHKKWQQVRERVHSVSNHDIENGLKNYIHHPDIQDLRDLR